MKLKKIGLEYKNKKFEITVKECNWFKKISGLIFTRREKAKALLFDFKKPVQWNFHSLFVFFPFIAIWLDDNDKIISIKNIKPFKYNLSPKKPFEKVIEIPINSRYNKIIKLLVDD